MNKEIAILVSRYQAGEREVVYRLWEKFIPLCAKWARSFRGYGDDEEDFWQDSYLVMVTSLERYDPAVGTPFEGYYKHALHLQRITYCRKKRELLSAGEKLWEALYQQVDLDVDVEADVLADMAHEKLRKVLGVLEGVERRIIWAYYYEHRTIREIGAELGMTYKAVEARKRKVLIRLRRELERMEDTSY